ncbi:hypothetical protein [Actinoplanes teichomyceticus]|uniref:Uncharacterized protein n=1 Tax=Actinoplanes teichomyceticus TaxID=1867 RepID=A0A561WRI2_ACTTI|nr:hypothetical protein [Actinoplanes teichomyceticus]TWG26477.1 hypothetical protein FHX34_1011463 [Actinoplanes teichomyceticus]GIF11555.1 hypothetical protein Ate01nite_15870 [Actinoplanes teichomyceticus]
MPGWRVERTPRAALRSVPAAHGGFPPMPPHSQGAERRPERRAGRAGHRWVLRALVIGGLAGVAWLLTAAAAHAAGPGAEPVTGSLSGAMRDNGEALDSAETPGSARAPGAAEPSGGAEALHRGGPAVTRDGPPREPVAGKLLTAAVQPLEPGPNTHQHVVTPIRSVPDRGPFDPVRNTGGVTDTAPATDAATLDQARLPVPVPLRASSGDTAPERVVDERDATGHVADPGPAPLPAGAPEAPAPVTDAVVIPRPAAALPEPPAATGTAVATAPPARAGGFTRALRAPAGDSPVRRAEARSRSHAHRHATAARPVAPEAIRTRAPGGDRPVPARRSPGAVSGIPVGGPGAFTENGSSAVLPSPIADGAVACHRCATAPDVDVRRHDAEAPTVSPD